MKVVHIVTLLTVLTAVPVIADETIPLATMTCKQFVDSPKESIGVILTWIMGYLHDADAPAEINFTKMEQIGKALGTYCGQNPTHGLMTAVDKVSG